MRLKDHEKISVSLSSAVTRPVIGFMKDQGTKDEVTRLVREAWFPSDSR